LFVFGLLMLTISVVAYRGRNSAWGLGPDASTRITVAFATCGLILMTVAMIGPSD
jgi:hypothetical protein